MNARRLGNTALFIHHRINSFKTFLSALLTRGFTLGLLFPVGLIALTRVTSQGMALH
ncbi:hypothetical protein [Pectobacterium parmentieri]|nr:hypothetical protein [Pectobacterium parmentieri]